MTASETTRLHATAIGIDGQAAVLIGPSGSGKSSLALQLIALGADLISDDQCEVFTRDDLLCVKRPATLPKAIEARGFGLIRAPMVDEGNVVLVIQMDKTSQARMPDEQYMQLLSHQIKMIPNSDSAHFPATILLYLQHGPVK